MDIHYLLCAYGPDRPGIVESLSDIAVKMSFSIADSRMVLLGDHFSVLMLLAGPRENAPGMEKAMHALADLTVSVKEVHARGTKDDVLEYSVRMVGEDSKGIVHGVTTYLKDHRINVLSLDTAVGRAPHSGTPLFKMTMVLEVPKSMNLRELKSGLIALSDRLNMDIDIEPFGI
ncbi:MAG: ACT domain-containing protein [Spirochaetota bacterium]